MAEVVSAPNGVHGDAAYRSIVWHGLRPR